MLPISVDIELDKDTATFQAGETVSGKVVVRVLQELKITGRFWLLYINHILMKIL